MNQSQLLKLCFEYAILLLGEGLRLQAKKNRSHGFAVSMMISSIIQENQVCLSVARFGILATRPTNEWQQPFHNKADDAIRFALMHGGTLGEVLSTRPLVLFTNGVIRMQSGAHLDGTKTCGVGVAGGKNSQNTRFAKQIVTSMQKFLQQVCLVCLAKKAKFHTEAPLRVAAELLYKKFGPDRLGLPDSWENTEYDWDRGPFTD